MERTFLAGEQPERGAGWRRDGPHVPAKGGEWWASWGVEGDPGRHVSLSREGRRRVFTLVFILWTTEAVWGDQRAWRWRNGEGRADHPTAPILLFLFLLSDRASRLC